MRVAILSDIHGNLPALNAVLQDAASRQINTFWSLGDVVGYGPWPVQCWMRLQSLAIDENAWVVGNHDLGLINRSYVDGDAATVINYQREVCQLIQKQIGRMKVIAQPRRGVILAHGVPKPNDPYWTVTKYTKTKADPNQAVRDLLKAGIKPQLIIVGHTHKALFWRRGHQEDKWQEVYPKGEIPLGDLDQQIVYLNPGSVGQPRDEGREASYCYIDWEKMSVCFRRIPYDLAQTRQKMKAFGYPETLIERWYSD